MKWLQVAVLALAVSACASDPTATAPRPEARAQTETVYFKRYFIDDAGTQIVESAQCGPAGRAAQEAVQTCVEDYQKAGYERADGPVADRPNHTDVELDRFMKVYLGRR